MNWPRSTSPGRDDSTADHDVAQPDPSGGRGGERHGRSRRAIAISGAAALLVAGAGTAVAVSRNDGQQTADSTATTPAGWTALMDATGSTTTPPVTPPGALDVNEWVAGTLTKLTATKVTITDDTGTTRTWALSSRATAAYRSDAVQTWLADHDPVGQRVIVAVGVENGATVAVHVRPAIAHVYGTVLGVDGSTISVRGLDGFTLTVDTSTVSGAPTFRAGDQILAVGTVARDGRTLVASQVVRNPDPGQLRGRAGGPGWGHMGGMGGRGGWNGPRAGMGGGYGAATPGDGATSPAVTGIGWGAMTG